MLNSLIKYEQITTTLPKAKELKPQIDKVITLGKKNNLQSKQNLFARLQSKTSVVIATALPAVGMGVWLTPLPPIDPFWKLS